MTASDHLSAQFRGVYTPPARHQEIHAAMPPVDNPAAKRNIEYSLAKSSMPASHLSGISRITTSDPSVDGYAANYNLNSHEIHISGDFSGGSQEARGTQQRALLHEIGHHNDHTFMSRWSIGHGEAKAENYADQHQASSGGQASAAYDQPGTLRGPAKVMYKLSRRNGQGF